MPEVLRVFVSLLTVGLLLGLAFLSLSAWSVLGSVLWPRHAERVRGLLEEAPGRCLLLGILDFLTVVAFLALLGHTPLGRLVPLLLLGLAAGILTGWPAAAGLLGERVLRDAGRETTTPLSRGASGVGLIVLAAVLPILGQILLAGVLLAALGASVAAMLRRMRESAV